MATAAPARTWACAALALCALAGAGCGSSSGDRAAKTALVSIGAGLKGPAGLEAAVYAKGPATTATVAFDARGRLWLAAAGLSTHAKDGVYLVAKPGARAVRVVKGLDDPLGLLWHGGTLYVASVGRVDAFGGFDGSRFRTRREIVDGPVSKGENNELVLSPQGRLVMGITATCDHCQPASRYAGAVVSFRADGSDLRVVAGHVRAPVGLAYVPATSDLLASMNLRDDLGAKTPGDWLGLIAAGQDWHQPACYAQGGSACTGAPTPIASLDPHAAASGVAIVSGALGGEGGDTTGAPAALVAEWQLGKIQRVALTRTGSTYTGAVSTYLTGVRSPFAVTLAPSGGSLIVGDWASGTIYRIRPVAAGDSGSP
jgi:glucose/arabinose dehydrogenase